MVTRKSRARDQPGRSMAITDVGFSSTPGYLPATSSSMPFRAVPCTTSASSPSRSAGRGVTNPPPNLYPGTNCPTPSMTGSPEISSTHLFGPPWEETQSPFSPGLLQQQIPRSRTILTMDDVRSDTLRSMMAIALDAGTKVRMERLPPS